MFQGSSQFKDTVWSNLLPSNLSFLCLLISEFRVSYIDITEWWYSFTTNCNGPVLGDLTNRKTYFQKTEPNQS